MTMVPLARPRASDSVEVDAGDRGFSIRFGDRVLRTPSGAEMLVPTRDLAERLASEWRVQSTPPQFARMPLTRLAFTAVDRGDVARDGLVEEVARFAANDLITYVAEAPRTLVERQKSLWEPWRAWARTTLALDLPVFTGVMPGNPGDGVRRRSIELASDLGSFELIGLVAACGLFGSAVLAFALARGVLSAEAAHALARLDEVWQESQWGQDPEAALRAELRREEARVLERWFEALRDSAFSPASASVS